MADIQLQRPQAGQNVTITPNEKDRLQLKFEPGDATLTRDGDHLVFTFGGAAEGEAATPATEASKSSVTLTDFYKAYNAENMPTFLIGEGAEQAEVGGEQFFAGMAEDLMPAAGPGAGAGAQGGGTIVSFASGSLLGGIDSLDGLDQTREAATFLTDFPEDTAPNLPPVINGVTVFEDEFSTEGDFYAGQADAIESGVGRNPDGSPSPTAPNQKFGGDLFARGQVNATDPEGGALTFTLEGSGDGAFGDFEINASTGIFEYIFDDALHGNLSLGQIETETFRVIVTDPTGLSNFQDVTITIRGSNDQPILEVTEENFAVKDAFTTDETDATPEVPSGSVFGSAVGSDVDDGHELTYSVSTINPNLLDQATYDRMAKALADLEAYKDDVENSPFVQDMSAFLEQLKALDLSSYLEKVGQVLPKLEEALTKELTNALENIGDAADTSGAMANIAQILQVEFGKLDTLVNSPVSGAIVDKFTDFISGELAKLPQEGAKVDAIVEALVDGLQGVVTSSLNSLFDQIQKDFDAFASDVEKIKELAENHPLTDLLANASNSIDAFIDKLQAAVSNADADKYQENNVLPDSGATAYGLYGQLTIVQKDDANGANNANGGDFVYTLYTEAQAKELGPEYEAAYWALQMRDDKEQALDTEHFTVYVADEHGAWDYKNISFDVFGANDAPVIHAITEKLTVQESGHGIIVGKENLENAPDPGKPFAMGQIVATDIDLEALTYAFTGDPDEGMKGWAEVTSDNPLFDLAYDNAYGTLYLNSSTGSYMYKIDNDKADGLNEDGNGNVDPSYTLSFTVTDGDVTVPSKDVTLTIEGTNDRPVFTQDSVEHTVYEFLGENDEDYTKEDYTDDLKEKGPAVITGTADFNDPDNIDSHDFSLSYDLPNFADFLRLLNINGMDYDKLDKIEDITQEMYETFAANMPKSDEATAGNPAVLNGLYGKMTLDADGDYTYALYTWDEAKANPITAAAFVALQLRGDDNDALPTENFSIYVKDENGAWDKQDVSFKVMGTSDAPVISLAEGSDTTVVEAGVGGDVMGTAITTASGGIVDNLFSVAEDGLVGSLSEMVGADTFITGLKQDLTNTLTEAFENMETDYSANFPIPGDAKADGKLNITDDDGNTIVMLGDKLNINNFGFDREGFVNALITNFKDLDISLLDATNLGGLISGTSGMLEGLLDGSVSVSDIKNLIDGAGDALSSLAGINLEALLEIVKSSITQTVEGKFGTLTLYQDGSYEYTLLNDDSDTNALNKDESATDSFTVKAYDEFGQVKEYTLEINVTGTNDKPIITDADNLIMNEDQTSVSGKATASDVDQGGTLGDKLTFYVGGEPNKITLDEYIDNNAGPIAQNLIDTIQEKINTAKLAIEANEQQELDDLNAEKAIVEGNLKDFIDNYQGGQSQFDTDIARRDELNSKWFLSSNQKKELSALESKLSDYDDYNAAINGSAGLWLIENGIDFDLSSLDPNSDQSIAEMLGLDGALALVFNTFLGGVTDLGKILTTDLFGLNGQIAWAKISPAEGSSELGLEVATYETLLNILTSDGSTQEDIANALKELLKGEFDNETFFEHLDLEDMDPNAKDGLTEYDVDGDGVKDKVDEHEGEYGSLIIDQNTGDYIYVLSDEGKKALQALPEYDENNPDTYKTENFTVYVQDENGAWDSKEVTVTIKGEDDVPILTFSDPAVDGNTHTTYDDEGALGAGTDAQVAKGSFNYTEGDGVTTVSINGTAISVGATFENIDSSGKFLGTLTITSIANGKVEYSYEQNGNQSHLDANGKPITTLQDVFNIRVEDNDSNANDVAIGTIKIDILDDTPTLTVVEPSSTNVLEGETVSGKLSFDYGADNDTDKGAQFQVLDKAGDPATETGGKYDVGDGYVTLTKDTNGEVTGYTFEAKSGHTGDTEFSFKVTDSDKDSQEEAVELTILSDTKPGDLILGIDNEIVSTNSVLNVALLVDSSGSFEKGDMTAIENALKLMLDKLETLDQGAAEVNVCLIDYDTGARLVFEGLDSIPDNLNNLWNKGEGGSNHDLAFSSAEGWLSAQPEGKNITVMLTDGDSTYNMKDTVRFETETYAYGGKTYTYVGRETVNEVIDDYRYVYKAADGSTIVRYDARGLFDSQDDGWYLNNEFGAKINPQEIVLNVDVTGKDLGGTTWEQGGYTFRLADYQSSGEISMPMLQVLIGGRWENVGQIGLEGPGNASRPAQVTAALKAAQDLIDNTGSDIYVIGYGKDLDTDNIDDIINLNGNDGKAYYDGVDAETVSTIFGDVYGDIEDSLSENALKDIVKDSAGLAGESDSEFVEAVLKYDLDQLEELGDKIEKAIETEAGTAAAPDDYTINGKEDSDVIVGFRGNETINAGEGNDIVYGGAGDDTIYGEAGNDILFGGSGADSLFGGDGDDILFGGINDLRLEGGIGDDLIILDTDAIDKLTVSDVVKIDGGDDVDVLLAGIDSLQGAKEKLANGDITNVELLAFGGNLQGQTAKDIIDELNITDDAGNIKANWTAQGEVPGTNGEYNQYSDGDITILVSKHALENNNF